MVTGAGGSIGSELCRQIANMRPSKLLLIERSEASLFTVEQELVQYGYTDLIVPIVANILDLLRMRNVFAIYKPHIVYHAAAHKHVYMMERQPGEAVENNTFGTLELATLALEHHTESFILISTDKAINPTSVMGVTKRLAEMEIMDLARKQVVQSPTYSQTRFLAVRFGNVLGSSGSVIPIFKNQISRGGPVKVTHPEVTRYFMTIPEAAGLVMQASVIGSGGDIFVLDMGQPVKIIDLAKQMIELSGLTLYIDINIEFTGLKPGEKLYEELQHHTESCDPTIHPRIMKLVANESINISEFNKYRKEYSQMKDDKLKHIFKQFVQEYTPYI